MCMYCYQLYLGKCILCEVCSQNEISSVNFCKRIGYGSVLLVLNLLFLYRKPVVQLLRGNTLSPQLYFCERSGTGLNLGAKFRSC